MDANFWEQRYQNNKTRWDIGHISTPIKTFIDQLENKDAEILVPGAGNGYEVSYLYEHGFNQTRVVEIATTPLLNLKKKQPKIPESHLFQMDFFEHEGRYDIIIEQTFFCALNPELRSAYVKKMCDLLKPQGKLVGLLFDFPLDERGPPFGGNQNLYIKYFSEYFHIKTLEACHNSIKPRMGKELFFIFEKKINMDTSVILTNEQIAHKTKRIAFQILESNSNDTEIVLAGIIGNGYTFAQKIAAELTSISDVNVKLCKVSMDKKNPLSGVTTDIPSSEYQNKPLVLVDDVLSSGTTLIYGIKHFLDVPLKKFKTAVLINRNHKKYPVKADFKGLSLSTSMQEHVNVVFENDSAYAILE